MRTFAEQLEYELRNNDEKLAEVIVGSDSRDQGLAEAVAYAYVTDDWGYLERRIEGDIAEEVKKRQRDHDDRMLASWDGTEPVR